MSAVAVCVVLMLIWVLGTPTLFVGAMVTADPLFGAEPTADEEATLPWRLSAFALCACLPPAGCLWIAVHRRRRWMARLMTAAALVGIAVAIAGTALIASY